MKDMSLATLAIATDKLSRGCCTLLTFMLMSFLSPFRGINRSYYIQALFSTSIQPLLHRHPILLIHRPALNILNPHTPRRLGQRKPNSQTHPLLLALVALALSKDLRHARI